MADARDPSPDNVCDSKHPFLCLFQYVGGPAFVVMVGHAMITGTPDVFTSAALGIATNAAIGALAVKSKEDGRIFGAVVGAGCGLVGEIGGLLLIAGYKETTHLFNDFSANYKSAFPLLPVLGGKAIRSEIAPVANAFKSITKPAADRLAPAVEPGAKALSPIIERGSKALSSGEKAFVGAHNAMTERLEVAKVQVGLKLASVKQKVIKAVRPGKNAPLTLADGPKR